MCMGTTDASETQARQQLQVLPFLGQTPKDGPLLATALSMDRGPRRHRFSPIRVPVPGMFQIRCPGTEILLPGPGRSGKRFHQGWSHRGPPEYQGQATLARVDTDEYSQPCSDPHKVTQASAVMMCSAGRSRTLGRVAGTVKNLLISCQKTLQPSPSTTQSLPLHHSLEAPSRWKERAEGSSLRPPSLSQSHASILWAVPRT